MPAVTAYASRLMLNQQPIPIPAFCDNCGKPFPSGFASGGSGTLIMRGNKSGPCPYCGGTGTVLDATYRVDKGIIEILAASSPTRERLEKLRNVLLEARKLGADATAIKNMVAKSDPEFSRVSDFLPKTPNELYQFLGVLIALIALVVTLNQGPVITEQQLTNAFTQALQNVQQDQPSRPGASGRNATKPNELARGLEEALKAKPSRNSPCSCGSGKKYKRCCDSSKLSPAQRLMKN